MGVITMMFTAAPAMGPTISGVIIDHLSWRYLFWLTIPFMVLAMLLVSKFLTVNLSDITKPKVDIPSAIASILGFGGLVYASSNFESLPLAVFVAVMIISLMIIAFFVKRQLTLDVPLLNLRVFEFKQFRYAAIILVCGSFLFLGMELLFPMYAQQVLLMTGTTTGLMLMPASIAQAIAASLFGALLDKKGGRFMLIPATIALLGSLGAAFFVGMTSIGEKMSQATNPQQDMLNGIHLAMACAFVVAVIAFVSAFQIKTNDWRKTE